MPLLLFFHIIMKRFLLSLIALVITSVCFAQDIIVQKNGSTIQAKVVKVTQTEVEYKKFNNQNGPTYTISTRDLQCINYQNGTKDTFVSPSYNPSIVTNETATQFSNDQQLLRLYNDPILAKQRKNAKLLQHIGIGVGAVGLIAGVLVHVGASSNAHGNLDSEEVATIWGISGAVMAVGAACYFIGKHNYKKASLLEITSNPIYQQEFNIGKNDRLMVGVDMLKDNTRKNQTLGLGVSYNF